MRLRKFSILKEYFLEYRLWVCCFFGYVLVKFLQLWILIHLFSKTLQFWEYAQFFSSYQRTDAWCMYISHREITTFSLECEGETRTWHQLLCQSFVLIIYSIITFLLEQKVYLFLGTFFQLQHFENMCIYLFFSSNWAVPFYVTVHYKWKTSQTGCCHSIKGGQDHLIEVTTKKRWK